MESLQSLRKSFNNGITKSIAFRKQQLISLYKMLEEHENEFCDALQKDLNKSPSESKLTELLTSKQEISYLVKKMDSWLENEKVSKSFITLLDSTWIQRQPYGVALCISTWNYPIFISISPLAGLLAAGNCVVMKPSEVSAHSEKLLAELLPKYLDQNVCRVELGDGARTGEILKEKFDYIVYTGNPIVAKIILEAAAKHLTPVTLELGGKSPIYLDKKVDIKMAVNRIIMSKFTNSGQTCIAPDYLLCHKDKKEEFIKLATQTIDEFYSADPSSSKFYCHIINNKQYNRLLNMINQTQGKIIKGGNSKEDINYIDPTLINLDSVDDILMKSEIFGPILPILIVESEEEAIDIINKGEKPLAIYVFSNEKSVLNKFHDNTTSGGLVFNDCIMQVLVQGLPFGGVGESGMGAYHGKFSIDQFTHKRAVLDKDRGESLNNLFRYPPYNEKKDKWSAWGLKSDVKPTSSCCLL